MPEKFFNGLTIRRMVTGMAIFVLAVYAGAVGLTGSAHLAVTPAAAQMSGNVPGNSLGNTSDPQFWRAIRKGVCGSVSIPDKQAACLVQSQGDELRAFRNGPMSRVGAWVMLAMLVVIALFFALRGRIRIDAGPDEAGRTIERFNALERFTHWLTASSFIVLSITGLNVLYGKYFLPAILGKSAFATLTLWGKMLHNYISWAFMLGILLMFVLWVKDNFLNKADLNWIAVGGGLFSKDVHPPAGRFNFGQKLIFWCVILGGLVHALTGLVLLFPFEFQVVGNMFSVLNILGLGLPTNLTPLQEVQYALMWHGVSTVVMIAIIIGHIYIGSLGMEKAFDAVGSGQVDRNWAKEHHSLWLEEVEGESPPAE